LFQEVDVMNTASQGALPSVLVVDDDEFSQEVFRMTLWGLGVTDIHLACNGLDGLRTLKGMQRSPDFLICDIFMPDMDGIEFLDQLDQLHITLDGELTQDLGCPLPELGSAQ
jgi:CheY-like chemotaxis protein